MDLTPFKNINPCGYPNLKITQLKDQNAPTDLNKVANDLIPHLKNNLSTKAY